MNITVKGLNIEYIEEGSGIPVLLLHGWGSSFDVYKGIMASLSDRCRLVAVNFPGCGNSETMAEPWDLQDYCDFVCEFMQKVGLKDPIMMGHSHGGRVTMYMAALGYLGKGDIERAKEYAKWALDLDKCHSGVRDILCKN